MGWGRAGWGERSRAPPRTLPPGGRPGEGLLARSPLSTLPITSPKRSTSQSAWRRAGGRIGVAGPGDGAIAQKKGRGAAPTLSDALLRLRPGPTSGAGGARPHPHTRQGPSLGGWAAAGGEADGHGARAGRTRGAAKKGGAKKPARDAFFPAGHAHRLGPPLRARGRRPAPPHLFPAFKGQAASVHHSPAWRRPGWRPWWFVEGGGGEKRVGGGERQFYGVPGERGGRAPFVSRSHSFFFRLSPLAPRRPFPPPRPPAPWPATPPPPPSTSGPPPADGTPTPATGGATPPSPLPRSRAPRFTSAGVGQGEVRHAAPVRPIPSRRWADVPAPRNDAIGGAP